MAKDQPDKQEYWLNELNSLGIEPKRKNKLNDKKELEDLAENIKQVYYQDYKTAHDPDIDSSEDKRFDYLI